MNYDPSEPGRPASPLGLPIAPGDGAPRRTLIFGAGQAGEQIARSIRDLSNPRWLIVGFLDDDPRKRGSTLMGAEVLGGREELPAVVANLSAQVLIIAAPGDSAVARDVAGLALRCGISVKSVPPLESLLRDWVDAYDVRDLNVDDLLGRRQREIVVVEAAVDVAADRTVLVTGAGGSIGRELCRQLLAMGPRLMLMLDHDESGLHGTSLSLGMGGHLNRRESVLADIRDARSIERLFVEERPQTVFHAAALKHVQSLERHPGEAVQTNVWGTLNILRSSAAHGVEKFVNISTDKAAEPANALGYSKRVAERITAWFGQHDSGEYVSTRFGNVLGSRGSFLETFMSQLANGEPVTVSHPDVSRFMMAIDEAVGLVIQAAAVGASGETLVLDMGEPVRILDIAEHLVTTTGMGSIEFTGLAEGEKLSEVLLADNERGTCPHHPLVTHVPVPPIDPARCLLVDPWSSSRQVYDELRRLASSPPAPLDSASSAREREDVADGVDLVLPQAWMHGD